MPVEVMHNGVSYPYAPPATMSGKDFSKEFPPIPDEFEFAKCKHTGQVYKLTDAMRQRSDILEGTLETPFDARKSMATKKNVVLEAGLKEEVALAGEDEFDEFDELLALDNI